MKVLRVYSTARINQRWREKRYFSEYSLINIIEDHLLPMASQAAGRGGGWIGGRGRGSPPQQLNRGLTPSIGAFLQCSGKGPSANETAIWAGKIKDYARSNFETPIDGTFRANGATGEYPSSVTVRRPVPVPFPVLWLLPHNMIGQSTILYFISLVLWFKCTLWISVQRVKGWTMVIVMVSYMWLVC